MNLLNRITDWLAVHPGFSDGLILFLIVVAGAVVVLWLARDMVCDDDPDEHAQNHRP